MCKETKSLIDFNIQHIRAFVDKKGENFDIRRYLKDAEDNFIPTKEGITIPIELIPAIVKGLEDIWEDHKK